MAEPEIQSASGIDAKIGNVWTQLNEMINGFIELLPNLAIALVVVVLFYFLARGAQKLVHRSFANSERSEGLGKVLGRVTKWGLVAVGLLVALAIVAPSVKPGDLVALLGVSSVAIGFAFKDILQNFLAGILILLRQPFQIGDQLIFNGLEGTVEDIETRATILKTYDGRRIVVPNGEIYTNSVTVNTAYDRRRSQYDIGIGYGDDIEEAMQIMVEVMNRTEGVLQEPAPEVLVVDLAGSSVNLRARWWTNPTQSDVVHVSSKVILGIKKALDDASVDMPYPTRVLLFHDQTEETDGDRTKQREGWPAGTHPPEPRTIAGTLRDAPARREDEREREAPRAQPSA